MSTVSRTIGVLLFWALGIGQMLVPMPQARAAHGGHHGGGGGGRHSFAPQHAYRAPRMSDSAAPARSSMVRPKHNSQNHGSSSHNSLNNAQAHTNATNALATGPHGSAHVSAATRTSTSASAPGGNVNPTATGALNATPSTPNSTAPGVYTYGYGNGARNYRAYGYGRGYRNGLYGRRYGYGRSQTNNLAVIARLRSVHASLARINHDYQGHRVRAMHAVSMAIRQLSHRSMVYRGAGFAPGVNNGQRMGMRQGGAGAGRGQPMTQAQSDARMSQDLRTLQGISMQLSSHGSTTGHARASGHVQNAIQELRVALSIR
jgi:hypothetical protein